MLPGYAAVMTPRVARVTLRQLLTMTAGFHDPLNDDALGTASDWVHYILKRQDNTPGEEFHYSNLAVHLLSPILVQATGQSVLTYARTHLFDPLGIPTTPAAQPVADQAHLAEYERAGLGLAGRSEGFPHRRFGSEAVASGDRPRQHPACAGSRAGQDGAKQHVIGSRWPLARRRPTGWRTDPVPGSGRPPPSQAGLGSAASRWRAAAPARPADRGVRR